MRLAGHGSPDTALVRECFGRSKSPLHMSANGDSLPGAPEWEVIATPGHTDDSTSFWNQGTKTLLSGDAVLSVGGRGGSPRNG